MTAYFDDAVRNISHGSRDLPGAEMFPVFLAFAADIEDKVITDVCLCTGDREFPDDLREKILGDIAVYRLRSPKGTPLPPTHGRKYLQTCRSSELLERLHSAFHELASRRLTFRFGRVQDSPRGFLISRQTWEDEQAAELGDG